MEYIEAEQILRNEKLCPESIIEEEAKVRANKLFSENIRLAYKIAGKYIRGKDSQFSNRISSDDIIQCALLGLWEACLRFDENKGFKLATYAVPYIDGTIKRVLRDDDNLKMSRAHKDIRYALYSHGFTAPLTEEEIDIIVSEGTISRKHLEEYKEPVISSIEDTIPGKGNESDMPLSDVIADTSIAIGEDFSEDEIQGIIEDIIKLITNPKHRDLVEEWLYSIAAGEKIRQEELSKKYNIAQSNTCRILKKALNILRSNEDYIKTLFGLN